MLSPLLLAQALATRRRALVMPEAEGPRRGRFPDDSVAPGEAVAALRLLVAGDSSAAGVGVAHQDRAVVGHLVRRLRAVTGRPVEWTLRARSGLTTRQLQAWLEREPPAPVDVAVVVSGVNDVVGLVRVREAMAAREALVAGLLGRGLARHVVFAPLPPVGRFPLLPEPLRRVLGDDARRHDGALAAWAAVRDGVSRADFAVELDAASMAADGFHPGEPVYKVCGEAIADHIGKTCPTPGLPGVGTLKAS